MAGEVKFFLSGWDSWLTKWLRLPTKIKFGIVAGIFPLCPTL